MPFVMAGITKSILRDIANYQIALLNIESSDLQYITDANFTFYVEPYDPRTEVLHIASGNAGTDADGNAVDPGKSRDLKVKGGPTNGRRFLKRRTAACVHSPEQRTIESFNGQASSDEKRHVKAGKLGSHKC